MERPQWVRIADNETGTINKGLQNRRNPYLVDSHALLLDGNKAEIMVVEEAIRATYIDFITSNDLPLITTIIGDPNLPHMNHLHKIEEAALAVGFNPKDEPDWTHQLKESIILCWHEGFPRKGRSRIRNTFFEQVNTLLAQADLPPIPTRIQQLSTWEVESY